MLVDLDLNKSLFLLFLVVCGNYIGELLGCKTQKLLSENIYMKHIVLLCLIFFTINLIGDEKKHPIEVFKKTIPLWLFYLILTKMSLEITIGVLSLLFILYVYDEYQQYLDTTNEQYNQEEFQRNKVYLQYAIFILSVSGFVMYYLKQKKEHSKGFNHITFLLGTTDCDFKK